MVEKSGMITKTKNCHNNDKIAMRVKLWFELVAIGWYAPSCHNLNHGDDRLLKVYVHSP